MEKCPACRSFFFLLRRGTVVWSSVIGLRSRNTLSGGVAEVSESNVGAAMRGRDEERGRVRDAMGGGQEGGEERERERKW